MIISKDSIIYDEQRNEYIVEERIGGGGFSSVFKIKNKNDNKLYALKTFSSDFEDVDELKTFKNEIQKAMEVKSDNVVQYIFFNDGEIFPELPPYIIMEYCPNGTLKDYLKKIVESENSITNEEIKSVFFQLIKGMNDINKKVIHRDIKLENILLNNNVLKISDFGISKSITDKTRTSTFKGWGTPEYIAPEGWKQEKNTMKMDIYSMGIVFYQIATLLKYPYEIKTGKDEEYRNVHLYGTVISPRNYNSDIEYNIESLILKMLEKEPAKRFDNWEEIEKLIGIQVTNKNQDILSKILNKRLSLDEENRKIEIENKKKQEVINESKKIISYSIYENIYKPIYDIVNQFNSTYASGKLYLSDYEVCTSRINEIQLTTISNKHLRIIINSIVDEKFEQRYQDPFFGNYYTKQYRPKLNDKGILAWGAIYFDHDFSYNLLLVQDESMYGKWYQLKNRNSGLNMNLRLPEPFAFDFHEIEKELGYINCTHIYTSSLEEYNKYELLNGIEKII